MYLPVSIPMQLAANRSIVERNYLSFPGRVVRVVVVTYIVITTKHMKSMQNCNTVLFHYFIVGCTAPFISLICS